MRDLARQKVQLREGLLVRLYSEELEVDGVVQFSSEEKIWVAAIDWNAIEHKDNSLTAQPPAVSG